MDNAVLLAKATDFLLSCHLNTISDEDAMRPDLVGMQIYDAPIMAVADAADPLFETLREKTVVHPEHMLPGNFLPGARRVVSFFLPFTERVKAANAADIRRPVAEWMHARVEGAQMQAAFGDFLVDALTAEGYHAVVPLVDARFKMLEKYRSNWSERHIAYICGLGTFGLSKGLITAKGVAGRFISVITDCDLAVTQRAYTDVYGYCTRCGLCAKHCPIRCIDTDAHPHLAKAHPPCDKYVTSMKKMPPLGKSRKPRYGCGKCQVATPCQDGIPVQ